MCGIAGFSLNPDSSVDRTLAAQALLAGISERGADAVGYAQRSSDGPVSVTKLRGGASALLDELEVPAQTAQALIHVRVPSVSGQAVLTLPVFAPVADLLHMSRQVAVLAYEYGAGLCELMTPTNGALMAILAAAGVRYDEWIRGAGLMLALVTLLGAAAVAIAVAMSVT